MSHVDRAMAGGTKGSSDFREQPGLEAMSLQMTEPARSCPGPTAIPLPFSAPAWSLFPPRVLRVLRSLSVPLFFYFHCSFSAHSLLSFSFTSWPSLPPFSTPFPLPPLSFPSFCLLPVSLSNSPSSAPMMHCSYFPDSSLILPFSSVLFTQFKYMSRSCSGPSRF